MAEAAKRPQVHVLSIAGSDSGGGAGIQADLKTMAALGAYGCSAITAVTAQNTLGVQAVHPVPGPMIVAQCDAVFADIRIDAVKVGMLTSADSVAAVMAVLRRWRPGFVVLDPVLSATTGQAFLSGEAGVLLKTELLPMVDLVTPNLPEAARLLGQPEASDVATMVQQAQALCAMGLKAVLLKGGHLPVTEDAVDCLCVAGQAPRLYAGPRSLAMNTHGTGCTLSSALAVAYIQHHGDLTVAVQQAKDYVAMAIARSDELDVGEGVGPLQHFHRA
ncbi:MAG: bifunctional hydroxymethylpyrimidine kinase/phosphomethylpyrimidine kinase [Neisseriaceae bacterium]|nr:bifunctional hydroxymethylpyrimidine kinase/phosphomethylpyrimidine kinase [Neisseriaceae bacterium]